jgi:diacylglycerol kinase family enzyme
VQVFDCSEGAVAVEHILTGASVARKTRRVLVILNPGSGSGLSERVFQRAVLPALVAAGCEVDVRRTAYQRHATEIAKLQDQSMVVDVIVCCGGDGLINEVVNGNIAGRNLPLAVVPTGTDNSLAASLGIKTPYLAILTILKV